MLPEIFRLFFKWIYDRKARLVLTGYRPEIICLLSRTANQTTFYLLTKPTQHPELWAPPQEGIELNETRQDAALRCIRDELGLREAEVQIRKTEWLGKIAFPPNRRDERDLHYSLRRVIGKTKMIGKGYYVAHIRVSHEATIGINKAEILEFEWVHKAEFIERIGSNSPEKEKLLLQAISD